MFSRQVISGALRSNASRGIISRAGAALPSARSYATPASSVDSKPPVAVYGLDGTYASALVGLFALLSYSYRSPTPMAANGSPRQSSPKLTIPQYTAAAKTSALDSASKALATLSDVFKKDPKLAVILTAPSLSPGDKSQIIQELQRHTGGQDKGDIVKNFLQTLAEHNRLSLLEGVCEKFGTLMGASRGEVDLTVISAAKLDDKTLKRLETAVGKSEYSQGKKLKVITKVNPDIKGGLIVEIGDRTIDLSVSSKISKMNKLLTDTL
ncbi:ATP synthase F0 subcomplex subunit OSCP atp5 [Xylographa pallens]|nr:ATP synthase F0 subcomplex subunit OSCP atp5 [Xylographa pallens]